MDKKIKITSLGLGFTYAGSFFGAGYVSGKELYEFFSSFGIKGYYGIILSMFLFFVLGVFLVRTVQLSKRDSFDEVIILADNKPLRALLAGATVFMMFGIFVIMSAGAGALLNQVFDLPHYVGCIVFTLSACIVSLSGISGTVKFFSSIVPVLVICTIFICIVALKKYGFNSELPITNTNPLLNNWWFSAITYVSYNMITLIGTIIPVGANIQRKRTVYGGILFGCFIALSLAFGILLAVASVYGSSKAELPMLNIAMRLGNITGYIYAILLIIAMFGTSLSSIVAIIVYFENKIPKCNKHKKIIIFIIGIITFLCSLSGFGNLVNTLYPIFGYIGFAVLALIIGNFIYLKINKS